MLYSLALFMVLIAGCAQGVITMRDGGQILHAHVHCAKIVIPVGVVDVSIKDLEIECDR